MVSGVRDDVRHDYTCFIRRGEDESLHGGFLYLRQRPVPPAQFGHVQMSNRAVLRDQRSLIAPTSVRRRGTLPQEMFVAVQL
jgi:hypothetical protein